MTTLPPDLPDLLNMTELISALATRLPGGKAPSRSTLWRLKCPVAVEVRGRKLYRLEDVLRHWLNAEAS